MAEKKSPILAVFGLLILILLVSQSIFVVDQTEKASVLTLGKPSNVVLGPGLNMKWPLIQNVIYFDVRILEYDAPGEEVLTKDKKTMVVDNYVRWRIVDPIQFYRTVQTTIKARSRIDDIVYSELREALGQHDLTEVVSTKRGSLMEQITTKSNVLLKDYGISVIDVRIKRADLPPQNQEAIYGRMRAERERQAKQYRSEGREEGVKITTGADRERTVMLADAKRESEIIRGQGDAEAIRIYAEALNRDPKFYAFVRSLDAYKKTLKNDTKIILTPSDEFLRYFQ